MQTTSSNRRFKVSLLSGRQINFVVYLKATSAEDAHSIAEERYPTCRVEMVQELSRG